MTHPFFAGLQHPRVIAHRGWLSPEIHERGAVENSTAAVAAAVSAGADIIESDCHLTADGVAVLTHDTDLLRVTGDPRVVAEVSCEELERIFADRGGLLTLRGAFEQFPTARFNIDIKAKQAAETAGRIIGEYGQRALVNSFSDERRRHALAVATNTARGASGSDAGVPATAPGTSSTVQLMVSGLLAGAGVAWTRQLLGSFDALQLPERQYGVRVVTPRLIEAAHRAGVEVHVWTVNDAHHMNALIDMGVDGIVTDHTDVALHERASWATNG